MDWNSDARFHGQWDIAHQTMADVDRARASNGSDERDFEGFPDPRMLPEPQQDVDVFVPGIVFGPMVLTSPEVTVTVTEAPQEPAGGTFATVIDLPGASPAEYLLQTRFLDKRPSRYGDGDCAQMAQVLAEQQETPMGLAGSGRWRAGNAVMDNKNLNRGTVIASGWDANGYYPNASRGNHVAIFLGFVPGGIKVLEQTRGGGVKIRSITNPRGDYFNNPNAFRVVLSGYPPVPGVPARR